MSDAAELAKRTADVMWADDAASQQLGMKIVDIGPGRAALTMTVRPDMVNGLDVCHGGIVFTLADSAMAFACNSYDNVSLAVNADISWLRPSHNGDVLTATATEVEHSGRTGIYDVVVRNHDDHTVAVFRGTVRTTGRSLIDRQTDGG